MSLFKVLTLCLIIDLLTFTTAVYSQQYVPSQQFVMADKSSVSSQNFQSMPPASNQTTTVGAPPQSTGPIIAYNAAAIPPNIPSTSVTYNAAPSSVNPSSTLMNTQQNSPQVVASPTPAVATTPEQNTAAQFVNAPPTTQYTEEEKEAWFKNCRAAVNDKRAVDFAVEFCTCGWTHISSGKLPAELLTDTKPEANQQRNTIMHAISQRCIVELMVSHNLK